MVVTQTTDNDNATDDDDANDDHNDGDDSDHVTLATTLLLAVGSDAAKAEYFSQLRTPNFCLGFFDGTRQWTRQWTRPWTRHWTRQWIRQ